MMNTQNLMLGVVRQDNLERFEAMTKETERLESRFRQLYHIQKRQNKTVNINGKTQEVQGSVSLYDGVFVTRLFQYHALYGNRSMVYSNPKKFASQLFEGGNSAEINLADFLPPKE